jgi:monofunctional biosynthetic peptidoglycan transglycosylase
MATSTRRAPGKTLAWSRIIKIALLALACAFILYELWMFSMVIWYAHRNPSSTSVMREQLSELRETNPKAQLQFQWTDYSRIDSELKKAVVASEDSNFIEHDGVEWDAIRKAWEYNQEQAELGKHRVRGGSTITQQVAKNLFLSGSRTYLRKGQELILAYMIERVMPKKRILEIYLNIAEWGVGVFGAQAAAHHYYRTDAARLSAGQAATLAAMLPNPRYYDKHRSTAYLNRRSAVLQRRMLQVDIP